MGNSTRTLQQLVDSASTIGDLNPVLTNTGGFASEPALTIANAAMSDLIAERYNWKWNRIKVPAFPLTSNQQDYASISLPNLGWIESAAVVDINSTSFPKTTFPVEAVRDLPYTSGAGGMPGMVSWLPNSLLEYDIWPGVGSTYTNPIGTSTTPANGPTNITDPNGVILVLTTYGTTAMQPVAATGAAPGTTIADGTCVWTIADPTSSGFRVSPRPPQSGNVWLLRVFAQARAPRFTSLTQTLDPLPDDQSHWFEDGFIAYAHRHSSNPNVQKKFPGYKQEWMRDLAEAMGSADREQEAYGFYPSRTVVDPGPGCGPTVGNPLNWRRY